MRHRAGSGFQAAVSGGLVETVSEPQCRSCGCGHLRCLPCMASWVQFVALKKRKEGNKEREVIMPQEESLA